MICLTIVLLLAICLYPDTVFAAAGGESDPLENLSTIVAVLTALSVASERLVELIKGIIPLLNKTCDTPGWEGARKASIIFLSIAISILTSFLSKTAIQNILPSFTSHWHFVALGLLASGGSGLWNGINSYILELKNLREALAQKTNTLNKIDKQILVKLTTNQVKVADIQPSSTS